MSTLEIDPDSPVDPPAIIGVGVASKTLQRTKPKPWVLEVYTTSSRISPFDMIDQTFHDMEVRVVNIGRAPRLARGAPRGRRFDPLVPGCSVSTSQALTGTLGCFAIDDQQRLLGITTSHAILGLAPPANAAGTDVYHPSLGHPALPQNTPGVIGVVHKWTTINNAQGTTVDAASILIQQKISWKPNVPYIGASKGSGKLPASPLRTLGRKFGQWSGFSEGKSRSHNSNMLAIDPVTGQGIFYVGQQLYFRQSTQGYPSFAMNGDSGSIIWDKDRVATGIIVAAAGSAVIATPITRVEKALGARVIWSSR